MWLYIVIGIFTTILGLDSILFKLFMLISFVTSLIKFSNIKLTNTIDFFVFLFLLWILFNSVTIDYPNHMKLWIQALVANIFPISFYFLAKSTNHNIEEILEKATIPMLIAMICGLIFYYTEPGWYTAVKMRQILSRTENGAVSDVQLIEYFRLSSFWVTPYVIGYATMLFADFNINKLFSKSINKKDTRKHFVMLALCIIIIVLTQFRATIYAFILTTVYLMFFAKNKIKLSYIIAVVSLGIFILSFVMDENSETGAYFRERMMKGVEQEELESRFEIVTGGISITSITGNGYGRFGANAPTINGEWAFLDSEYLKVLAELGIIGFIPFVGLITSGLLKTFRKKKFQLEFIILAFYAMAFMGSSCLSVSTTFPFIFWYTLGRVSLISSSSYRRNINTSPISNDVRRICK